MRSIDDTSVICGSDLTNLPRALPARVLALILAFFAAFAAGDNRRRAFESTPRGIAVTRVDRNGSMEGK